MSDSELLSAALRYAALNWRIFPLRKILTLPDGSKACTCKLGAKCDSIGKHPAVKWKTEASCDEVTVRRWWGGRFAGCGIGLACGQSGLVVFDADGPTGILTLAGFVGSVGRVAVRRLDTARAKTARGYHVFFRGEAPTSSDPVTKLDVRSTGGFVVLAPSPHASGHVYSWEVPPWPLDEGSGAGCGVDVIEPWNASDPIAECPPALLEYARKKKAARGGRVGDEGRTRRVLELGGSSPGKGSGDGITLPAYLELAREDFGERLDALLNAPDWAEVARALACIPADCSMDEWVRVGMALHQASNRSLQGLDLWDKWSSTSKGVGPGKGEYAGRDKLEYSWASWKTDGGTTIRTLFDLALRHGYKRGESRISAEKNSNSNEVTENNEEASLGPQAAATGEQLNGVNGHTYELPPQFTRTNPIWVDWSGGKNPKPLPTCRNVRVALRCIGIEANYNQLNHRMNVGGQLLGQWGGELSDNAVQALRSIVQREFDFDPPMHAMRDAAEQECLDNAFHPIKNYFKTLQWDGRPRIDTWLSAYMSAEDNTFNRAVARLWLVAGVRRILQPGCKFDQMPVFESPEGKGKSTALQILAGGSEYYSDTDILNASNQQQMELIAGKWIYEFGELTGIHGADVNKIKAFISRQVDRGRRAWGRYAVEQPRTGIFAGTTNDHAYLVSQTGNRRFWPVECGAVDLDGITRDRDQLWAEALLAERNASLFLPESLWGAAREVQEGRMIEHPWVDVLSGEIGREERRDDGTTEMRIASADLIKMVGIKEGDRKLWHSKEIIGCMTRLGWTYSSKLIKIDGKPCRGFTRAPVTGR